MVGLDWIIWPGLLAARRPFLAMTVLLFLAIACGAAIPMLRYDDYVQRGFDSDSVHTQNLLALSQSLGGRPTDIPVLVEFDDGLTDPALDALRQSVVEIQLLDGVSSVQSLFTAFLPVTRDEGVAKPVVPDDANAEVAKGRIADFAEKYPNLPNLLGKDGHSALLVVTLERGTNLGALQNIQDGMAEIIKREFVPGMYAGIAGEDVISLEIVNSLRREVLVLNAIGAVLAFVVAFLIFSNWRTTLIVFLPASLSAQTALLLFLLLGYPVTVLNVVVPILVLVIALADSVHLAMHHLRTVKHVGHSNVIDDTIRAIGPANAVTSLTTAICFAAVAVTGFPQLDEIAILGLLSVLAAYGVVLAGYTVLARFLPAHADTRQVPAVVAGIAGKTATIALSRPYQVLLVATAVLLLGALASWNIRPWFTLAGNLPAYSQVLETHETIQQQHGGYLRLWIETDLALPLVPQDRQSSLEDWQRIVTVSEAVERAAPGYAVVSLPTIFGASGVVEELPENRLWNDLPQTLRTDLLSDDGMVARAIVFVPEPMRDEKALATQDRIESAALEAGANRVTGFSQILRHDSIRVIEELFKGTLLALLLASLAIALFFRWPASTLLLLLPNLLPLLTAVVGIFLFNNGKIGSSAVLALTVGFGIAVDDSIHLTNAYLRALRQDAAENNAIAIALRNTAPAMIATTVLIGAGLAASLFSGFATVVMFGSVMIATLFAALLADLFVLPAILKLWQNRFA